MSSYSGPLNEELMCLICLDVFTDPVTTPCGHNFCKTCLNKCWTNTQTCCCPSCKKLFSRRLNLEINTTLTKVVQHFKKLNQGQSEVCCDGRKQKAIKSCLTCPSSYCETHLEPHHRVPRLKKHKLINAGENMKDYICQKHERPLELFCRDDQTCVCLSCTEADHRNHNTVPIEEESQQKKTHTSNDFFLTYRTVHISYWMIISLGFLLVAILFILPKQYTVSTDPKSVSDDSSITWLQQQITDLKRRNAELEQLLHADDDLHLIQLYSSLYSLLHSMDWFKISSDYDDEFTLERALTQLKDPVHEKLIQIGLKWAQKFAVDVTLDPDTANPYLILSNDGKQVSYGAIKQDVPKHPKRFDTTVSVLAKEGFSSGRFYYEVQVKGKTDWDLGVARESINRKGKIIYTPMNGYCTVMLRNENEYSACKSSLISLSLKVKPEIVGVFVDYEEGLVSFYDVGSRSHIFSFIGQNFTDKLYPYFSPCHNHGGKNSKPLIITPVS